MEQTIITTLKQSIPPCHLQFLTCETVVLSSQDALFSLRNIEFSSSLELGHLSSSFPGTSPHSDSSSSAVALQLGKKWYSLLIVQSSGHMQRSEVLHKMANIASQEQSGLQYKDDPDKLFYCEDINWTEEVLTARPHWLRGRPVNPCPDFCNPKETPWLFIRLPSDPAATKLFPEGSL